MLGQMLAPRSSLLDPRSSSARRLSFHVVNREVLPIDHELAHLELPFDRDWPNGEIRRHPRIHFHQNAIV